MALFIVCDMFCDNLIDQFNTELFIVVAVTNFLHNVIFFA